MAIEYKFVEKDEVKEFKDKEWKRFNKECGYVYKQENYHLAAFSDDKPIGVAYFDIVGGIGHLKELIVRKEFRGKNIGSKLMDMYESFCVEKGCHKLFLMTTPENMQSAFALYKKKGFKVVAELKDHEFHFDNVLMTKRLEVEK